MSIQSPQENIDLISDLDAGIFAQKLARAMADVGLGVAEHGKKGRVTITFDMERVNDSSQVNVSHKLSYAKPTKRGKASEEDTTATTVYVGSGGKLTLMPDNQPGLFTQPTEEGVA